MPSLETLRSFVNTWECDENDHLNVQFYFTKFEEADRQFRLMSGLSEMLTGPRHVRHVRYHGELHAAALVRIDSHAIFDGPHDFAVVHVMCDASSGRIAASALDGYAPAARSVAELSKRLNKCAGPMPDAAAPRNFDAAAVALDMKEADLLSAGAALANRATVMPRDCGLDGRAEDRFLMACFTDGAPHVWERTMLTRAWLEHNDYGRVALEMKLTRGLALKAGTAVHVVSGVTGVGNKTFTFRHHMFDSAASRVAATLDVTALVLNLETRRAMPLPDGARADIERITMR